MGRFYVDLVNKADELGMEVPNEINKKVLKVEKETKEALGYIKMLPDSIKPNIRLS